MLIAQITDFHVTVAGGRLDRQYATAAHLARAVDHINQMEPRPDVILATGDLVDVGQRDEYARLRDLLAPLHMPVYLIPGNHDAREALLAAFADHAYLPDRGFVQYVIEDHPLRLVALDTLIPKSGSGELCEQRLDWLQATLAAAPDRPTVVFMHHPPFDSGIRKMDEPALIGRERFARIVAAAPQVERVLCGHLHRPVTQRFAGTVASVAPATAHQLELNLTNDELATVMEPPAVTLHHWSDGALVTHTSYITSHERFTIFDGQRWIDSDPPFQVN
ncbi:MAG: phosphodiesterase [Alphaproteobacteria bacterium]